MKKKIFLMLCVSMFATSTFAQAPVLAVAVDGTAVVQQNQIPELPIRIL